jgi:hypothetical protein
MPCWRHTPASGIALSSASSVRSQSDFKVVKPAMRAVCVRASGMSMTASRTMKVLKHAAFTVFLHSCFHDFASSGVGHTRTRPALPANVRECPSWTIGETDALARNCGLRYNLRGRATMNDRVGGPQLVPSVKTTAPPRLQSWKQIAGYLQRDERTVRRWAESEGLPIHRRQHGKSASVLPSRRSWTPRPPSKHATGGPGRLH